MNESSAFSRLLRRLRRGGSPDLPSAERDLTERDLTERDLEDGVAKDGVIADSETNLLKDLTHLEHRVASLELDDTGVIEFDVERMLGKLTTIDEAGVVPNQSPASHETGLVGRAVGEHRIHQETDAADIDPKQLGEYEFIRIIGRGGISTVYHARHQMLDRDVAIKRLRRDRDQAGNAIANDHANERFRREMAILGGFDCPHIVAVNDARLIDGEMMLVMELIDGVTLRKLIREQGRLSLTDACEVVHQICSGLSLAHANGIVHRDLKPANVMLSNDGVVKILDFGLASLRYAKLVGADPNGPTKPLSLTSPSTIMGTIDYISPEQIDDARRADTRSDIYALGCLFYMLLTGRPPFCQEDYPADVARLMAHVSITPKPASSHCREADPVIDQLIAKMLSKSADMRPANVQSVADTIAPYLGQRNDLEPLTERLQ